MTAMADKAFVARIRKLRSLQRVLKRLPKRFPAPRDGHAPGHRHLGPPPTEKAEGGADVEPRANQPWIRTTHSDSQRRRPRR